jgi:NADH dehydrogenase FAD-containing subunit
MTAAQPKVVIVGAGFGGLTAAQSLARVPVEVTVIDRHNYHYFQPLSVSGRHSSPLPRRHRMARAWHP